MNEDKQIFIYKYYLILCHMFPFYMGVDQKVLARSYVFGDHSSWLKFLRERSAMEFAKETSFFFAKDSVLDSWRHACALTYLQTPLPCR